MNFYHNLLQLFLKQHNLGDCYTCKEYMNLDKEYLVYDGKKFCKDNCKSSHQFTSDGFM